MRLFILPTCLIAPFLLMACAETTPVEETQETDAQAIEVEATPQRVIETYLRSEYPDVENLRYSYGSADLDGRGESEFLVYVGGDGLCETDGCNLHVLQPDGDSFRNLGTLTNAQLPIGVLATTNNGYKDLGMTVGLGGLENQVRKVPFNGTTYVAEPETNAASQVGSLDIVTIGEGDMLNVPE